MIKLDLMSWESHNIDTLASFYGVPKRLSKKQRIDSIARHIYNQHYQHASMDPEEEARLIAEQAERRRQMQQLQQQWRSLSTQVQSPPETNIDDSRTRDCYSDIDIFTQDKFDADDTVLHIRYVHSSNDLNNPKSTCYSDSSFFDYIEDPNNKASQWIREYDPLPELKNLEPEREFELTDEGHNGIPSLFRIVAKLPDKSAYILDTSKTEETSFIDYAHSLHPEQTIDPSRYNAFLIAPKMRIGNLQGTFYISQTHGQAPGYDVYILVPVMNESLTLYHLTRFLEEQLDTVSFTEFLLELPIRYQKQFLSILANDPQLLFLIRTALRNQSMTPTTIDSLDDDTIHHVFMQLLQQAPHETQRMLLQSLHVLAQSIDDVLILIQTVFSLETIQDQDERAERTQEYIERMPRIQLRQDSRPLVSYEDMVLDLLGSSPEDTNSPIDVQRRLSFSSADTSEDSLSNSDMTDLVDVIDSIQQSTRSVDTQMEDVGSVLLDAAETSPSSRIFE